MNPSKTHKSSFSASEDFQQKLRSWFQNRGLIDKLVVYLRSQMFIELQNHTGPLEVPGRNSISPKHQAVKLLVADFLLHENLLFALSVFCSEVPFLLNLKQYSNYIAKLANLHKNTSVHSKQPKPKFSKKDICDIVEALGVNLNKEEISIIHELYKSDKFNSLLTCLLYLLPVLVKKNKCFQRLLNKMKKKEKYFKKVVLVEKNKVKKMFGLLKNTHDVVIKHKTEMNNLLQKYNELQNNCNLMGQKVAELQKKESELDDKEQYLISKEKDLEKIYKSKTEELEKQTALKNQKNRELEDNNKNLLDLQKRLDSEKIFWNEKESQFHLKNSENVKLQEYEQKFRNLQEEVFEIQKHCQEAQNRKMMEQERLIDKNIQCRIDIVHQNQQTETDAVLNLEEYVNLMEKENSILKSGSFKQRQYITQLSAEIIFLKNRLDYLEKNLRLKTEFDRRKEMHEVAEKLYSPRFLREGILKSNSQSRRELFPEKSSSEFTNSNSKEDNSLTDEIVADAKNKLKELENESEALNRNFKNLQGVLSRNIVLSDKMSSSDSSNDKLSRRYGSNIKSLVKSNKFNLHESESNLESSPDLRNYDIGSTKKVFSSDTDLATSSPDRGVSFRQMYLKYKEKKREQQGKNETNYENKQEQTKGFDFNATYTKIDRNMDKIENIKPVEDGNVREYGENLTEIDEDHEKLDKFQKKEVQSENVLETILDQNESKKEEVISAGSSHSKSSSDFWK